MLKRILIVIIISVVCTSGLHAETLDTRIGKLEFTHAFIDGYPTKATVEKLFEEMDFQRAVQAYIWSIPVVSMAQWRHTHEKELGAENGQIVLVESYKDKLGGLTYNATTPYVLPFIDLAEGPWVLELPEPPGKVRGAAHDMWQIGITQLTEPGKYLFVGPGQDVPNDKGYKSFQSPTNGILLGIRLMPEDRDESMAALEKVAIYPYDERAKQMPRGYITPQGKPWMAAAPQGMAYWELLGDTINREPVQERDGVTRRQEYTLPHH